jgi:2-dehydropantoate 2-reductase
MKVCIFGAGAVGGHIAVRLLETRAADIAVVARGATLRAIRSRGLTLRSGEKEISVKVPVATDDPFTLPPQDLVVVTVKAPALPAAAAAIAHLIAPQGCAVFILNGIPWWWNHGMPGARGSLPLLDPDGALWNQVRPERTLGCAIQSPNDPVEPGVIAHTGPNYMILGEPDNSSSARLMAAAELFGRSGIEVQQPRDMRREIWRKLVQNASGNTLAALTRLALNQIGTNPELRHLMTGLMREILAVGAALGWDLRAEMDTEKIAQRAIGRDPGVRSSMLRDVIEKRPLEADAGLGQTQVFAREVGVSVPIIDVLLPLLRGLDRAQRAT